MKTEDKNEIFGQTPIRLSKWQLLRQACQHPLEFKPSFGTCLRTFVHTRDELRYQKLKRISPDSVIDPAIPLTLMNFKIISANVVLEELVYLAGMVATLKPQRCLELGTLDGNSTLQIALNTSKNAIIHTLDLPPDQEGYVPYKAASRRFEGSPVAYKITQHLGDSMTYDFARFAKDGPLDFIFIDANHEYEFVKSDTLKSLEILAEKGCILWHDATLKHPGVFQWLNELSAKLPIARIKGTQFAIYDRSKTP